MPLTTEIILHFYFPFKAFPENERERERERACVRGEAINGAISHRIEIAIDGERGRSEIAPSINDDKSSPTTAPLIAINGAIAISTFSRDRDRRRDLAKRRSRSWIFLSRRRSRFFSRLWLVFFWICVILLLFQTPENIFRKIF